jgi:predicted dehydrogenase
VKKKQIYRWGILGPGKIAHAFARALEVTDKGRLWAVGSRDRTRAAEFAQQYGAPRAFSSYSELIRDPEVDVIYIATPHHLHHPLTKECILHNKPVLCEKPVTINARQFKELSGLARQKGVFYMDALWTRFLPTLEKTIELVKTIGPVISLRADFGFKGKYDPSSRLFNPELGGGSLLDIGIYPVFLALLLLGEPRDIHSTLHMAPTGVDESMTALFSYPSGATARLFSTFMADTRTDAEIACRNGTLTIHNRFHEPSYLELRTGKAEAEYFRFDYRGNGYEYEAEEVMRCLDNQLTESPRMDHAFTLSLMTTLDRIRYQHSFFYPMEPR